ncbi:MAG: MFS transporter [Methylococcaceae bacterium]|nr:MFS transporter [Methylococcaceae bacterium]
MSPGGTEPLPYWRLSGFYFFYFAALGAFLPYWPLYLQAEGYDHVQIGLLMALLPATKLVSPNLWGWLADRSDRSVLLVRLSSWLTAACFTALLWDSGFSMVALATLLMSFFWNAPLPLFEAVTLAYLGSRVSRYSRIRLWGSVGFIASVSGLGWALDHRFAIACLPQLILLTLLAMGLVTLLVRERTVRHGGGDEGSLWAILRQGRVLAFLAVAMLIQVAHGPYYTFFSVYLHDHGYDGRDIGMLWSLGVAAEIALFLVLERVLGRFRLRQVLLAAILLGALRWWVLAELVAQPVLLATAQLLHAATFGASHAVAIQLVHRYFAGRHHGKGQALYSSLSYGFGGMVGSYWSGLAWDLLGPQAVFAAAAWCSFPALIIAWFWVDRPGRSAAGRGADGAR